MPLPKANNSLVGNSFFIFISRFFPTLANLLVVIWYSRYMPQGEYGNYQHFWVHSYIIYPLACFGIHVLIFTYSREFILNLLRSINAKQRILYFGWVVVWGGVFAFLQLSIGIPFYVSFLFLLFYAFSFILESFIIVCKAFKGIVAINLLYSVTFCWLHWYALQNALSLTTLFTWLMVITGIRLFIMGLIAGKYFAAPIPMEDVAPYDIPKIRSLWLHLGVYDITQVLFSWIDKFVISIVLASGLSAIYYNGSQNIPFLPILLSAAGSAVLMQLAGSSGQDEKADTISLMNRSGKLLSCIVFPVFLFLFIFRQELIIEVLTVKYIEAIPVFAVAVLVVPVRAYSFTTVLQRMHKGNIINIGSVADLVFACALMYPLYQWLGLQGVALSFVITTYLQASFYLIYSAKLLQTSPLKLIPYGNWILKLIVFSIMFIAIHYICHQYFTENITLILGAVFMILLIISSLGIELVKQSKNGRI